MRIGCLRIGAVSAALLVGAVAAPASNGGGGLQTDATGFFHFGRIDGADRAIDPSGRAMTLAGVDFVNPDVFHSMFLGYAPYARFVATNYLSREAWATQTAGRLREWGFNMLASHCATELFPGFPHADTLNLNNPFAKSKDLEWRISENTDAPSTGFPNVFHPDYEKEVFAAAAKRCAPLKDDPSLVGWFIDNELCWWGRSSDPGAGLFDLVAKLPPGHSARKALEEWLESNRVQTTAIDGNRQQSTASAVPRETKIGFLRLVAERYFSVNAAAIRAADPNHAVLGCRFARGTLWTHDVVWEEAGKYCDAVSLNFYPWCDLDRGVVLTDQGGIPIQHELRRVHALCRRPLLITEWSFPALDAGRPCLHGAGQRFRTQAERAAAVELYVRTLLAEPFIAGYNWFMWVDQPATGLRPALPEDSNYGLVNEQDEPYALVTEAFARVNGDTAVRKAGEDWIVHKSAIATNVHKSEISISPFSERERYYSKASLREGGGGKAAGGSTPGGAAANLDLIVVGNGEQLPFVDNAVGFHQKADGSWSLSNGLVRLSGRIGGAFMADEIAFGGDPPAGRFRTLLQLHDGERRLWTDVDRVTDVAFATDEATGIGTVTIRAEGGAVGTSREVADAARRDGSPHSLVERKPLFAMTARLSLAPGRADVLAEIVAAENLSDSTLRVERVFLRPFAAEASPGEIPSVPKLWKGPHEGWWRLSDGRRFGAVTRDAASCSFRFYVSGNGVQHPDAPFVENGPFEIAPGATWMPSSPMGALLKADAVEAR